MNLKKPTPGSVPLLYPAQMVLSTAAVLMPPRSATLFTYTDGTITIEFLPCREIESNGIETEQNGNKNEEQKKKTGARIKKYLHRYLVLCFLLPVAFLMRFLCDFLSVALRRGFAGCNQGSDTTTKTKEKKTRHKKTNNKKNETHKKTKNNKTNKDTQNRKQKKYYDLVIYSSIDASTVVVVTLCSLESVRPRSRALAFSTTSE